MSDTDDVDVKLSGGGKVKVRLREGREESWTQTGVPVKEPQVMGVWNSTILSETFVVAEEVGNPEVNWEPGWTEEAMATPSVTKTSDRRSSCRVGP